MNDLYDKHRDTLEQALEAIKKRSYWSPFPEHPKAYGEDAPAGGEAAFEARLGKPFSIDQPHDGYLAVEETSPYGIELDIDYPNSSIEQLIDAAQDASLQWGKASPEARAGVLIEVLDRLAAQSFEKDIAKRICEALRVRLTGEQQTELVRSYTDNTQAYRAYKEARFWWNKRTLNGFETSLDHGAHVNEVPDWIVSSFDRGGCAQCG